MGYRLVIAVCALSVLCSCAAFDSDGTPFEGFSPSEIPTPEGAGETGLSGYYAGNMVLDSNDCESVSDEVGAASILGIDVAQNDDVMSFTFSDDSFSKGALEGDKATFMTDTLGVRHIYYLTFGEEGLVDGSCEVFEASEDGVFRTPCASYSISLEQGEKPEAGTPTEDEEVEAEE
jgi:hypothetical protein